jgi:hypothetical protein
MKPPNQPQTESSKPKVGNYSQPRPSTHLKPHHVPPLPTQLSVDPNPPPKLFRPTPSATLAHFSSTSQGLDDDIQEVIPVKTEPRDPPPTSAPSAVQPSQDIYTAPDSHSLAPVEDDSFGYQDDQYAEYEQYEDGQEYGAGVGDQVNYAATEGSKGEGPITF